MAGRLIALEGVHGAGKTTLARYLMEILSADRVPVVFSRDQAGTPFSETIRNLNLDALGNVDLFAETFLVAAARRQTYVDVVVPALTQNQVVITERFVDAFFAYGFARGLPIEFTRIIAEYTCARRYPDLTLLLDLPPDVGLQRISEPQMHRIEREGLDFHRKLREGYLNESRGNSGHVVVIDAAQTLDAVKLQSLTAVRTFLST